MIFKCLDKNVIFNKKNLFKCKISTSSSFVELTQEISWIMNKIPVSRECSVVAGADTRSGTTFNQ